MKKKSILALGITIGMISSIGVQSFAGDTIRQITASINDTFELVVNEEKQTLPEEYHMLVYGNRTYLPVRALGDMLGYEVSWNDQTKTISLTAPAEDDDNGTDTDKSYRKLPQTYETKDFRLSMLYGDTKLGEDKLTRLFFRLSATGSESIRINPSEILISADGLTYDNYSSDVNLADQDKKLYSTYASEDNDINSYLTLPETIKNAEKIHVEIPVIKDTYKGQETEVISFDIDMEASK